MASSANETAQSRTNPVDFEKFLPRLYGGRSYLQASQQDFRRSFLPGCIDGQNETVVEPTSAELIGIAKRALKKGELEIAEKHCTQAIRKQKLQDVPSDKIWEPYFYLGEVLEKKAARADVELLQKQRLLLQAAALYNFTKNCSKTAVVEGNFSVKTMKTVSRKLLDIQDSLVLVVGGNPVQCNFDPENNKKNLQQLRNEVKVGLESLKHNATPEVQGATKEDLRNKFVKQAAEIRNLCKIISSKVKQFLARIIKECMEVLGDPPCDYEVVVLGSLARDEMTPYSDLEWAILISSEEDKCKVFFRNLTNLVHLQIINLGETILPSMGIKALSWEWFYDDITPRGLSFDGFLPGACKTPLGNMKDFELIHSPTNMADFQSNYWYKRNPRLAEVLSAVAPLESDKHELIDQYRIKLEKNLGSPCDSDNCDHDGRSNNYPSRGACRGMGTLRKDILLYGDMLPSYGTSTDGKLYDVKKEIYRLTNRVVAGLAKCFGIRENGAFEILDELQKKKIITSNARDNLASAVGIALKLRISTYLEAGKQEEQMKARSNEEEKRSEAISFYHLPSEEELFHFFFIATPLYEELRRAFLLDENTPESFSQQAFFDHSDAVKGHIYCRILKYDEALQCYQRALEKDPENMRLELRKIVVQYEINRSSQMTVSMEDKLEALLRRVCKKCNLPDGNVDRRGHYLPKVDGYADSLQIEDVCLLANILRSSCYFHACEGNLELARHIFYQLMALENTKRSDGLENFWMKFAYFGLPEKYGRERPEKVTSVLNEMIEAEGISTRSIDCLNELGQFLSAHGKYRQAYLSLQRALTMERTLYGCNFNPQVKTTLGLLGGILFNLGICDEDNVYYDQLQHLCESLSVASDQILIRKSRLYLALLCADTNRYEEAISNLQETSALLTSGTYQRESFLECIIHCQMATSLHALDEKEKALKSASDAKECLQSITGTKVRVTVTCAVAAVFCIIGRHKEAILVIEEGLQELDTQSEVKHKAEYLKFLGEVSVLQGLTADAERYYKEAVEIFLIDEENTSAIVECLLKLCNIMLEKGESSEVSRKLDEARKYASRVTNDRKMCIYISRIGECWEKLGDANQARNWYGYVLTEFKESSVLINFPLFETKLHIKLGDLTKLYFASILICSDISLTAQQSQKAERAHYDRAGNILRRQCSSGNVDSTTIQLFVLLASRYRTIDLAEEEKLLFEALKMSEAIFAAEKTCEMVAGILTGLSDIKWLREDYVSASEFLERSLRMEMELHSSDRYHPHVSELLFRLSRLHKKLVLINEDREQLGEAIQDVLQFLEVGQEQEVFHNCVTRKNAAVCIWSMGILLFSLEDNEKGNNMLEMANKIFEGIKENLTCKDNALNINTRETSGRLEYPNVLNITELVYTVLLPLFFPYATELQLDESSLTAKNLTSSAADTYTDRTEMNADKEPQERSSGAATQSSDSKIASLIRTASILVDLVASDERHSAIGFFRVCTTKRRTPDTLPDDHKKQSRDIESFESKMNTLSLVAESVDCDLRKGNIQQASKTIQDSFNPFLLSILEKNCPGNIDPAEFLINEALKAKESYGTMMMLVYLNLADKFPAESRRKAKICKLRGECNLSKRNYRIAALSFIDAAEFLSRGTTSDPDALVEHSEVLINLTKSHMLCNDIESAWTACQEGLVMVSTLESGAMKSRMETELFFLGAKCLINLATKEHELEKAVSFCEQGLATSKLIVCSICRTELSEFFALNYRIQKLLATALSRLNRSYDSRKAMEEMIEFFINIAGSFVMTSDGTATENDLVSLKFSRHFCSWIGQALVMSGKTNFALLSLTESLSAFFALGLRDGIPAQEEFLALLDTITAAKAFVPQVAYTPFRETIELCVKTLLKKYDDINILLRFFELLGQLYVDRERDDEAIMLYEKALEVVECMGNSSDTMNDRVMIIGYLAHCHRRQATKSTREGSAEARSSAEKYYQTGLKMTGDFAVCLKVSYADFLCDQGRFREASEVLEEVATVGERLWDIQVTSFYSSRNISSPTVKEYMEDHGELLTTAGILAYSTLVRAFVGTGKKREAAAACEKLSVNGGEVEIFTQRPPFMPYVLAACQKALLSLVDDQCYMELQNAMFPLSASNLAKLYHELDEFEPTQEYFEKVGKSAAPLSDEPAGSFDSAPSTLPSSYLSRNAIEHDESHPLLIGLLELLQIPKVILNTPCDIQKVNLARYSFVNEYHVYYFLGKLLWKGGNIDGAIAYYEHCLDLDENYNQGQSLVAALADVYRVKALPTRNDDKVTYTKWMNAAQECFEKLRQKTTKFTPIVERGFGSFLCQQQRFEEAISCFKNVLEEKDGTRVFFGAGDKPLVSDYLEREIEARDQLMVLPLRIFVYHEVVSAYLKLNQVENAQQSVLQMEKDIALFESDPDYPLILSVLGYTHKEIGNKERAAEIFVSVLEVNPGHPPVTAALKSCR